MPSGRAWSKWASCTIAFRRRCWTCWRPSTLRWRSSCCGCGQPPRRPGGWLNTRALEIIIADAGAKDQDTHKDWVLAGQAQAQLYVSRAGRATVLQRFEGDAVEEMRRRYGEQHGEEPRRDGVGRQGEHQR